MKWLLSIVICFILNSLAAQSDAPKREFRGVWVATVANIDYPRQPSADTIALKEQWKNLIAQYKEIGFNAVIFQVRPAADAFYPSQFVPWSKYLIGRQVPARSESFDPLQFIIAETHRAGMEFHAWFNPYRATMDLDTASLAPNHVFNQHRDWVVRYGTRYYLNPGVPAVRQHFTQIVAEVVSKYDVDAVHFDDYFYPYKIAGESFPDSLEFEQYGEDFGNVEDWRRSNTDSLIENIHRTIKILKPYVQLGVSPFGVWRNRDRDDTGSDTRAGATTYDDLYADITKWLRYGWLDYVVPQLYWSIGFKPADHATLLGWWGTRNYERNLYVGHAAYKVANNADTAWSDPNEIPKQIRLNRRNAISSGSVFFSSKTVFENRLGVKDSLAVYYDAMSLLPLPPDVTQKTFATPELTQAKLQLKENRVRLRWKPNRDNRNIQPAYYVVYRFFGSKRGDYDNPENIIHISEFHKRNKRFQYMDFTIERNANYTYFVTAVNRQHVESRPSSGKNVRIR